MYVYTHMYMYMCMYVCMYVYVCIYMYICTYMYVYTYTYVALRHTSAYVSIRQHTSAYVSIRQHTSAYVGIRQHSSAYGSIHILCIYNTLIYGAIADLQASERFATTTDKNRLASYTGSPGKKKSTIIFFFRRARIARHTKKTKSQVPSRSTRVQTLTLMKIVFIFFTRRARIVYLKKKEIPSS
jgi:hypothetical protein